MQPALRAPRDSPAPGARRRAVQLGGAARRGKKVSCSRGVQGAAPPPPSRTDRTRLVSPPVLTGHVSSLNPHVIHGGLRQRRHSWGMRRETVQGDEGARSPRWCGRGMHAMREIYKGQFIQVAAAPE